MKKNLRHYHPRPPHVETEEERQRRHSDILYGIMVLAFVIVAVVFYLGPILDGTMTTE